MSPSWLAVLWLVGIVIFALIEAATAPALVSIWFSAGALAALAASFVTDSLKIQIVVFLLVSILCLLLVRPLTKKHFTPGITATNADSLIGASATVVQKIDNVRATGQIQLRGQVWTARSTEDLPLEEGTLVTVVRIEGVKAIVVPASEH